MNEPAEQALTNFRHEHALSLAHAKRADGYLNQFLQLMSGKSEAPAPSGQTVRCVREWTRWLAENGPALKQTVAEETGVKFTERGTPHTFLWDEAMADDPDDALPPNVIIRMQGPAAEHRGRPPMIYFLWSQRFDVHPLFGVGPVRSDDLDLGDADSFEEPVPQAQWAQDEQETETLLGVIQPEPTAPERFATMEEWNAAYEPLFDDLVASGVQPTEDVKQLLRDTLPEGVDANTTLAVAYQEAVRHRREAAEQ